MGFDNLLTLVNSAELLLRDVATLLPDKERKCVDAWLKRKMHYDILKNCTTLSSNSGNIDESSMLSPIDEVSEEEESSNGSSIKVERKSDIVMMDHMPISEYRYSTPVFENNLSEYMVQFKMQTDVASTKWINDFVSSLLATEEDLYQYNEPGVLSQSQSHHMIETFESSNACDRTSSANEQNECRRRQDITSLVHNFIQVDESPMSYESSTLLTNANSMSLWVPPTAPSAESNRNSVMSVGSSKQCSNCLESAYSCKLCLKHQIHRLQKARIPLLHLRQILNDTVPRDKRGYHPQFREYLKLDVVIEMIDISIEMKNQLNLGHSLKQTEINHQADVARAECLNMLSLTELVYLFTESLEKIVDVRESSWKIDEAIMKQDSFIVDQKFLIRHLNEVINECKTYFKSRNLTLNKKLDDRAKFTCGPTGRNIQSIQDDNMLTILLMLQQQKQLQPIRPPNPRRVGTSADIANTTDMIKSLVGSSVSRDTKVTRQKNKLIIQQEKNEPH